MSKGYGQIWTKDETELMLNLEIQFQGERDTANIMCQYLHNKMNRQIWDKRDETTYMNEWRKLFERDPDPTEES
jgi:hypothetical protein